MATSRNSFPIVPGISSAGPQAYAQYGQMPPIPENNNLDNMLRGLEFATFTQQQSNWPVAGDNMMPWSGAQGVFLDRNVLEQRAFAIKEKLRYTANTMNAPHQASKEILEAIDRISANSIVVNIKLYFTHWHKNAPFVHQPTFNPCTAALPLVLALMSLGGMVGFQWIGIGAGLTVCAVLEGTC